MGHMTLLTIVVINAKVWVSYRKKNSYKMKAPSDGFDFSLLSMFSSSIALLLVDCMRTFSKSFSNTFVSGSPSPNMGDFSGSTNLSGRPKLGARLY